MRGFWIRALVSGLFAGTMVGLGYWLIRRLVNPRTHPVVTGAVQGACFGFAISLFPEIERQLGVATSKPDAGVTAGLTALFLVLGLAAFGAYLARHRFHEQEFRARIERAGARGLDR